MQRRVFGEESSEVAGTWLTLSLVFEERGDLAAEEAAERAAISIFRELTRRGEMAPQAFAVALNNLVKTLENRGDCTAAIPLYEEAISTLPDHRDSEVARSSHGACLTKVGRYTEAEAALLRAYREQVPTRGADWVGTVATRNRLVALYETWSKPEQAAEYRR